MRAIDFFIEKTPFCPCGQINYKTKKNGRNEANARYGRIFKENAKRAPSFVAHGHVAFVAAEEAVAAEPG